MTRNTISILALTLMASVAAMPAFAADQPAAAAPGQSAAREPLLPGLGNVHHQITTSSPDAQKYFDQGLALTWGFNHDAAERAYRQAATIDPDAAMAWWGIAYVLGPNYNLPGDPERGRRASEAIAKARALETKVTPAERDYIEALAVRYGSDGAPSAERDRNYAAAMRSLAHKYPNDDDAQAMFAESLMDLHPWALWNKDGTPSPDTNEIVSTLETVLARNPNHIGANHYYIHAVEASANPERGLPSAARLGALAPGAGHLVHMPAHIYIRTGRYEQSADANAAAVKVDSAYLAQSHQQGVYPMMYFTHNIQFLCESEMLEGRSADALKAARELETKVPLAMFRQMPTAEFLEPMPLYVMVRFGEWDGILKEPAPPTDLKFSTAMWHYARGQAFAGKGQLDRAYEELLQLDLGLSQVPDDKTIGIVTPERRLLELGSASLAARIASKSGNHRRATLEYRDAVAIQDTLPYEEPPSWYESLREPLGAELLASGDLAGAEAVYREDLRRNPGNPLSLYGLSEALKHQGNTAEAAEFERKFHAEWPHPDVPPPALKIGNRQLASE